MLDLIEIWKKCSMLYWYPKIKDLPIPQPRTVMVPMTEKNTTAFWKMFEGKPLNNRLKAKLLKAAKEIGFPLFMRTDQASAKHSFKRTCYVPEEGLLFDNMRRLFDTITGFDLPFHGIIFREFIEMDSQFTAFSDLPISPERRYFAEEGEILCHHPYWPKEAMRFHNMGNVGPEDWAHKLQVMNTETEGEITVLSNYAAQVSQQFDGAWSIDFCKGKDGRWYLIDLALATLSWHDEACPQYKHLYRK